MFASASAAACDRWSAALPDCLPHVICDRAALEKFVYAGSSVKPSLVVCDEALIDAGRDALLVALGQVCGGTPILMVVDDPDTVDLEWIYCGMRGCCARTVDAGMLQKAIATLLSGEVWLPRRLIAKVISDVFTSSAVIPVDKCLRLELLTQRECEVAKLVTEGLNNKLIARQLDVSERTVKAHLGNIFQKLEIDNRLMLALTLKNSF